MTLIANHSTPRFSAQLHYARAKSDTFAMPIAVDVHYKIAMAQDTIQWALQELPDNMTLELKHGFRMNDERYEAPRVRVYMGSPNDSKSELLKHLPAKDGCPPDLLARQAIEAAKEGLEYFHTMVKREKPLSYLNHWWDHLEKQLPELPNVTARVDVASFIRGMLQKAEKPDLDRLMAETGQVLQTLTPESSDLFYATLLPLARIFASHCENLSEPGNMERFINVAGGYYAELKKLCSLPDAEPEIEEKEFVEVLQKIARRSDSIEGFSKKATICIKLLEESPPDAFTRKAILQMIRAGHHPKKIKIALACLEEYKQHKGNLTDLLNAMTAIPVVNHDAYVPVAQFRAIAEKVTSLAVQRPPEFLKAVLDVFERLGSMPAVYDGTKQRIDTFGLSVDMVLDLPGNWYNVADMFKTFCEVLQYEDNTSKEALSKDISRILETPERLRTNLSFLAKAHQPHELLNDYLTHDKDIPALTVYQLYRYFDLNAPLDTIGPVFPELTALIKPYAQKLAHYPDPLKTEYLGMATKALTRYHSYIDPILANKVINQIEPEATNNWARIGELTLSHSKWKYDAMTRWKGMGRQVKQPALLEASGLFQKTPKIQDVDEKFHGSFYHVNPETGLCIELRRGYIVISKPEVGTLVIRNSSRIFGRDLIDEPAYFSDTRVYNDGQHFLDWEADRKDFTSVFSKFLNKTYALQKNQNLKIKELLDSFDETMTRYTEWKNGVKNGEIPPGFKLMLEAAVQSAERNGALSPFGKGKYLSLSWVNPYSLPYPVKSFDTLNSPDNLTELQAFRKAVNGWSGPIEAERFKAMAPKLFEFLSFGLTHGLELVLSAREDAPAPKK